MPSPSEKPDNVVVVGGGGKGTGNGDKTTTSPPTQRDKLHEGQLLSTPPPMENSEQKQPGTAYHDAHSSIDTASPPESKNAPTALTASTNLAPPPTMPPDAGVLADTPTAATRAPSGETSTNRALASCHQDPSASSTEIDPTNPPSSGDGIPAAQAKPTEIHQKKTSSSSCLGAAASSPIEPHVIGLDSLMKYPKIIDKNNFGEPTFEGVMILAGGQDSGKSSTINSIACPDGKRLVPVNKGPCTNCFLRIGLFRVKGKSNAPTASIGFPDQTTFRDLSIEEAHNKIDTFMKERANESLDDIETITIKLTSPHVPTMTLIDTSGLLLSHPQSFDVLSRLLGPHNEPISLLLCIKASLDMSPSSPSLEAAAIVLKKLHAVFVKKGYDVSQENTIFVLSQIDKMVDYDFAMQKDQEARYGGKFWYLKNILSADATILGLRAVGLMNPDSSMIDRGVDRLDLYTREKRYFEENGITDEISAGRKKFAELLDVRYPRHIQGWTNGQIESRSLVLRRTQADFKKLGVDPTVPDIANDIKKMFLEAVSKALGNTEETCLDIVMTVIKRNNPFTDDCLDILDEIAFEIGERILGLIASGINNAPNSGDMNLDRFKTVFSEAYCGEAGHLNKSRVTSFVKESNELFLFSKNLVRLSHTTEADAIECLEKALAKVAVEQIVKPVRICLEGDSTGRLTSIVLEENEPEKREQLKKNEAKLKSEIILLQQLLPKDDENPASSDDENHDKEDNRDDENGNDCGDEQGGKGPDGNGNDRSSNSDTEGSTGDDSSSSGDEDDGNEGRSGAGLSDEGHRDGDSDKKSQQRRSGERTKCCRELASLSPLGIHTSQSPIRVTSSSSDSEDFSSKSRTVPRKRKGRGSPTRSSKRKKTEKKIVQLRLAKGVKIKSHFPEGWFAGEIKGPSKVRGKDFQVRYDDGERWEFSTAELYDGRKHQIIG